jgi:2-polyprenyl-6-methoxyphenol hydroxylase-like FAD-dependent oxidoreductase
MRNRGLVGIGGLIPISKLTEQNISISKGTMTFCLGRNGFFGYFPSNSHSKSPSHDSPYHVSDLGDSLGWWSTYALEEYPKNPKSIDMEDVNRQLRERHAIWSNPVIQAIINQDTQLAKHIYPTWTSPPIPTWSRNGIILVGDAAHALPSTSGQGSSQALEDVECLALFLAHELRHANESEGGDLLKTITTAAQHYEALRRPHVTKILEISRKMQNQKRDMSVVKEWIMFAVMWAFRFFPSILSKSAVEEYDISEEVSKAIQTLEKDQKAN